MLDEKPLTEQRVIEIVLIELEQFKEAIGKAVANVIDLNNAKITEQLKELGVIK